MIDFENYKKLFDFLKMPNNLWKHWTNTIAWNMVETIHEFAIQAIRPTMQKAHFIFISCDEVTTTDNQSWIYVHVYVVETIPNFFDTITSC